ncbi:MAG: hypothetical protein MMC33_008322 [Icmadophila ericetorum]|nr:hypothetical protein [Icmadophila ericetorum]
MGDSFNEPLYENNGSLVSCGNGSWCCQPESVSGTCNCSTGQGTFSVGEGIAQTTIELGGATSTVTVTEIVLPAPPSTPLSAESSAVTHTLINGPALNSSATPADPLLSAMATERESISVSQSNPTASITYSSVSSSTTAAVEILPTSAAHYSPQDKNVTHSKGFEIGAPVGGMAVIALLAVASYYAYGYCQSKRKRKRRETIIPNPHVLQSSIYADQLSNGPDNTNPFGPRNSQRSNDELQLNTLPYSRNGSDEGNPFMRTSPSNTNRPPPPQAPPRFAPSNNRSAPPPVPPRFASYNHTPSPPPPPPPSRFSPPTTTQILADAERTVPMRPERPAGGRRTNNDRRGQYSRVPDTSRAERPDWQNMQNRL